MDKILTSLSDDEVLLFQSDQAFKVGKVRLLINDFINRLPEMFKKSSSSSNININYNYHDDNGKLTNSDGISLFERGISCEVLKMKASGWQKGKIKVCISVDFYPDLSDGDNKLSGSNLELSLEEIRQTISKETH